MNAKTPFLVLMFAVGVIAGCGGSATQTSPNATTTRETVDPFVAVGKQPTTPTRVAFSAPLGERVTSTLNGEFTLQVRDVVGSGPEVDATVLDQIRQNLPTAHATFTGDLTLEVTKVDPDQTRTVHLSSTTTANISGDASATISYGYTGDIRYLPNGEVEVGEFTLSSADGVPDADRAQIEATLASMRQTFSEMSRGILDASYNVGQRRVVTVPRSASTPSMRIITTYRGRNGEGEHIFDRVTIPSDEPLKVNSGGLDATIAMTGTGRARGTWSDRGWTRRLRSEGSFISTGRYSLDAENSVTVRNALSMTMEIAPRD